jgi:L-ribulose-5-phosphate 3-epimerase
VNKAINIWSFHPGIAFEEKLQLAKDAGFDGIEIELAHEGPVALHGNRDDLERVRTLAERVGITLSGLATGLYWELNPVSENAEVRSRAFEVITRQLECAARLGIDNVLVVPGAVGVDFIPGAEVVRYDVAYQRAADFLARALPRAEELGVTICIENVWNKFLLSPLEMRDFVDGFGSRRLGVYFDVGNALASGYPEQWIAILGERIERVHLKDYRRAVGTVNGFVELLSGDVDWPAVMRALRESGYDGWLTAEMIPPLPFYKFAPETLIHNTSRAIDAIVALAPPPADSGSQGAGV